MRDRRVVLVVVLAVGCSVFGGLYLGVLGLETPLTSGENEPADADAIAGNESVPNQSEFQFAVADAGLNYTYAGRTDSFAGMISNASVYTGDVDGDEWPDVLLIGGEDVELFENVGGRFEHSDALPAIDERVRSAAFLDYDDDGSEDLLLLPDGDPPILLENVGGTYERRDVFDEPVAVPVGAAVADYDGDGCTDLFVYQNGDWADRHPVALGNYSVPGGGDNGNPNVLYRGTCGGFERVDGAGITGDRWTLAASFVDLDGDELPDIHAANDFNYDVFYRNRGNGTFERIELHDWTNRNGMSSEVADVTGDGRLDAFVTNIYYPQWAAEIMRSALSDKARGNNLITGFGNGSTADRGEQYGIDEGGWGWAAVITDFDDDGDEDLFHATSNVTFMGRIDLTGREARRLESLSMYNYPAVWSRTSPTQFSPVSPSKAGFEKSDGRGVARLDYDRDGDQDLLVASTDTFRLYENRIDGGESVQLRVLNADGGDALGAVVTVDTADRSQTRRVHGRTDYLSQDSRLVHVGVGDAATADVHVEWRDGSALVLDDVAVGQRLVVDPDGVRDRIGYEDS